jgi:hypothetical protein
MIGTWFSLFIGFLLGAGFMMWTVTRAVGEPPPPMVVCPEGHTCARCGKPTDIREIHPGERVFHGACFPLPSSRPEER